MSVRYGQSRGAGRQIKEERGKASHRKRNRCGRKVQKSTQDGREKTRKEREEIKSRGEAVNGLMKGSRTL